MTVTHTAGILKKFRRTPWRFQQTVEGSGSDMDGVVSIIVAVRGGLQEAMIPVEELVF